MIHLPLLLARIVGDSMEPSFSQGDVVFAWRWPWRLREGHIVIARPAGRRLIKRIAKIESSRVFLGVEHPWGWTDLGSVEALVLFRVPGRLFSR